MGKTKTYNLDIPAYFTIEQYQRLISFKDKSSSKLEEVVFMINSVTNIPIDEIRTWDGPGLKAVADKLDGLTEIKNEFHPLIEWDGQMLGFNPLSKMDLGEYIDLENLAKDPVKNLTDIVALLYRPVTKETFGGFKYAINRGIKVANNKVENVFKYYTVKKYDSLECGDRADKMKDFPVHVILGALNFISANGLLYLSNTLYSNRQQTKTETLNFEKWILADLSHNTGDGLALSSVYQSQEYSQLQERAVL